MVGFERHAETFTLGRDIGGNSFEDRYDKAKSNLFKATIYFIFYFDRMSKSVTLDSVLQ